MVDEIRHNSVIGLVQSAEAGSYNWWGSCGLAQAGGHALGNALPHHCFTSRLFPRREPVPDGSSPSDDGIVRCGTDGDIRVPRPASSVVRLAASRKWNRT